MAKSTVKKPKIIGIVGPTSSGKTALAISLAKRIGGEVISVDSRQVYKGLNIGTGKVTKKEMLGIPHHFLDVASPKQVFSVSEFVTLAREAIADIFSRGKVPILCGGTGLYYDALLGSISIPDVPPNPLLRANVSKKSTAQLYALLEKKDPRRASEIDRHNPVRLIRALEIAAAIGTVPEKQPVSFYDCLTIGINPDKTLLHKKITERLSARMKAGMLREGISLHKAGLSWKRMEELGLEYRAMARYFKNEVTKEEMVAELTQEIKNYAKRQMTWFKRNKNIYWITDPKDTSVYVQVKRFLEK